MKEILGGGYQKSTEFSLSFSLIVSVFSVPPVFSVFDLPLSVFICVHLWFHFRGFLLKQAMLLAGRFDAEVLISERGSDAAALGAVEQAELHQVRLVDFLDGVFFFAE